MHESLQGATFHVEHIVPRSAGGSDTMDNLALACPSCKEKIVPREMSLRPGPALKRRGLPGKTFQAVQVPDHFARHQLG